MTHNEIVAMLEEAGLPLAYDHFAEGESPDPPFLVFLFPSSDNLSADGRVYQKIDTLHIELYTDLKQPELEESIEAVLDGHDIFYNKTEVWIETEHLYEVLYSTEVLRTD
jgi:hypothetical protein